MQQPTHTGCWRQYSTTFAIVKFDCSPVCAKRTKDAYGRVQATFLQRPPCNNIASRSAKTLCALWCGRSVEWHGVSQALRRYVSVSRPIVVWSACTNWTRAIPECAATVPSAIQTKTCVCINTTKTGKIAFMQFRIDRSNTQATNNITIMAASVL